MFDAETFIADCRAAIAGDDSHKSVRELVARAVSDPGAVIKGLGGASAGGAESSERMPMASPPLLPRKT